MNNQKKVSYAVLNAIQKLTDEKTKPQFRVFRDSRGNAYLNVTNAVLLWTNFSGTSYGGRHGNNSLDQFGKDKRYFNLALDEETANIVEELGWNVKECMTGEEDYPVLHYVKVSIRIQHPYTYDKDAAFPSDIHLVTCFNGKETDEELVDDEVSRLDGRRTNATQPIIDVKAINCQIRSYHYDRNGNSGIALALSTRTVYADEISMFADPHDAELARNSIKVESVDDKK